MGEIVATLMMLATASATAAVTFMHEHRGHTGTFRGSHEDSCQVMRPGDCAHNHHSTFRGGFAEQCAPMVTRRTITPHFVARGRLPAKQRAPVAADGAETGSRFGYGKS